MAHLTDVLILFKDGGLTMKRPKCLFFHSCRILWSCNKLRMFACRFENMPHRPSHAALTESTKLWSCLGLCNVNGRFLSNFAQIAEPMTNKLRNDNRHTFPNLNEVEMNQFWNFKQALVQHPVLSLPLYDLTYVLETHSCGKELRFVLVRR